MDFGSLAIGVLEDHASRSMEYARAAVFQRCRVLAGSFTSPPGFNTMKLNVHIFDEGIEHSGSVGSAADARDDGIREAAELIHALGSCFPPDDGLEGTNHCGEGVGAYDRSDDVVGVFDGSHPVTKGCIRRILQCPGPIFHDDDIRTEEPHPEYIE